MIILLLRLIHPRLILQLLLLLRWLLLLRLIISRLLLLNRESRRRRHHPSRARIARHLRLLLLHPTVPHPTLLISTSHSLLLLLTVSRQDRLLSKLFLLIPLE